MNSQREAILLMNDIRARFGTALPARYHFAGLCQLASRQFLLGDIQQIKVMRPQIDAKYTEEYVIADLLDSNKLTSSSEIWYDIEHMTEEEAIAGITANAKQLYKEYKNALVVCKEIPDEFKLELFDFTDEYALKILIEAGVIQADDKFSPSGKEMVTIYLSNEKKNAYLTQIHFYDDNYKRDAREYFPSAFELNPKDRSIDVKVITVNFSRLTKLLADMSGTSLGGDRMELEGLDLLINGKKAGPSLKKESSASFIMLQMLVDAYAYPIGDWVFDEDIHKKCSTKGLKQINLNDLKDGLNRKYFKGSGFCITRNATVETDKTGYRIIPK